MIYNIKAIPTTYAGVNFRSRLEARWAAFFDLVGWKWDYEPFDLDKWTPDFLIRTTCCEVLVEVKPVDARERIRDFSRSVFAKAFRWRNFHQVLLLGKEPIVERGVPGVILDPPDKSDHTWVHLLNFFEIGESLCLWREAGNAVQWGTNQFTANEPAIDIAKLVQTGLRRAELKRAA